MGFLDSIKGKLNNTAHVDDLCEHLRTIGMDAQVVDKKGPEAIHHHVPIVGNDILRFPRMGVIKVKGAEFDYVEVIRMFVPSGRRTTAPTSAYYYAYVLPVKVPKGDDPFSVKYQEDRNSPGNFHWFGGDLARSLSEDQELRNVLVSLGHPTLRVAGIQSDQCVAIVKELDGSVVTTGITVKYGYGDFPSPDSLKGYSLIAKHVKQMESQMTK
jgi:hypothetical protein